MPFLKTPSCAKGEARTGLDDPKKGFGAQVAEDYLVYGDTPTGRTGVKSLEDYLSNPKGAFDVPESRVRAYRHSDTIKSEEPTGWATEMDYTRRAFGKDSDRKWYHFVISPDPKDRVSPEEVAEIAQEWAERVYPGAQWTVIVHDDNTNHIPHAHICVNAVMPDTGKKIHRSNAKVRYEWNMAQKIGREHNLSTLPTTEEYARNNNTTAQETKRTAAERAMDAEGRWSWKADIKRAIENSVKGALSWDAFIDNMADLGFTVTEGRRGVCFQHPRSGGHDMRVLGATLGSKWTKDAILDEMGFDFSSAAAGTIPGSVKPSERYAAKEIPAHLRRNAGIRAPRKQVYDKLDQTLNVRQRRGAAKRNTYEMLEAIATLRREGIGSLGELTHLADAVERETLDVAAQVDTYSRGFERAMSLYELVKETDAMALELKKPQPRFFDRDARKARNELEERFARNRERIDAEFSRAKDWLVQGGYDKLPEIDQAARLAYSFEGFHDEMADKLGRLRQRANQLINAKEVAMRTVPVPAARESLDRGTQAPKGVHISKEQVARIIELAKQQRAAAPDDSFMAEQDVRRRREEWRTAERTKAGREALRSHGNRHAEEARSSNIRAAEVASSGPVMH